MKYLLVNIMIFLVYQCYSQINYNNGTVNYKIPIIAYSDPKNGLSHQVSIDYITTQGIKVSQLSSNLGLGWKLNAGGEILRVQHGQPDDQYCPTGNPNFDRLIFKTNDPDLYSKLFPTGFLYRNQDIIYPIPRQLAFLPMFS